MCPSSCYPLHRLEYLGTCVLFQSPPLTHSVALSTLFKLFMPSFPMDHPRQVLTSLYTELCNLPMESCTGKSFEALYLGLFVYSESIWRIILLKPKLLSHRSPKTKDISSSRVTAACAPDLPREASHPLARPPPTLQWIRDCPSNLHTL